VEDFDIDISSRYTYNSSLIELSQGACTKTIKLRDNYWRFMDGGPSCRTSAPCRSRYLSRAVIASYLGNTAQNDSLLILFCPSLENPSR
jgi:hypothetical protein